MRSQRAHPTAFGELRFIQQRILQIFQDTHFYILTNNVFFFMAKDGCCAEAVARFYKASFPFFLRLSVAQAVHL